MFTLTSTVSVHLKRGRCLSLGAISLPKQRSSTGQSRLRTYCSRDPLKPTTPKIIESNRLKSWISAVNSPRCQLSVIGILSFAGIAYFVTGSASDNLLLSIDHNVQQWVMLNIPATVRSNVFGRIISNSIIQLDLLVGMTLLLLCTDGNRKRGFSLFVLVAIFFYAGVGSHSFAGILVKVLKQIFHRQRPNTLESSFAFPSGHLMSVTFLTGVILYVLIPVSIEELKQRPAIKNIVEKVNSRLRHKNVVCAGCCIWTAVGRIGANAHWVSDTIAGCLVGIALLSLFTEIWDRINKRLL